MGECKYTCRKVGSVYYDDIQQYKTWCLSISNIPAWKDDWLFNQGSKIMDVPLKNKYEKVCNEYVAQLCIMWNQDTSYGWWVNNEVGGVWLYGDFISLNMDDIVYIVNNNIKEEVVVNWHDYVSIAAIYELNCPNLKSWVNGCPRLSKEEIQTMQKKKNMDYKIGDKVSVSCNNIAIGVGVVDSVNYDGLSVSYTIRLEQPINYVQCLTDELELVYDDE